MNARAITYRRLNDIPDELGHRRQRAGDGVRQHGRDQRDRRRLHAQSLDRRQGALRRVPRQRAGRGRRRRHPHAAEHHRVARKAAGSDRPSLEAAMPEVFAQFVATTQLLEKHYRDMQDLEFTVERGKLWMLQTRNGKRTAPRRCGSRSTWPTRG
jgi:pyruvate,orthophosphate dikinase